MIKITAIVIKNGIDKSLYQAKCKKIISENKIEKYRMRIKNIAQFRYRKKVKVLFKYEYLNSNEKF